MNVSQWLRSIRAFSLTATAIPVLLATVIALAYPAAAANTVVWWTIPLFALSALLLHMGTNVLNDYYDYVHGVDGEDDPDPTHPITHGVASPRFMQISGHLYFLLGIVAGVSIAAVRGPVFLGLGLGGALLAYAYTSRFVSLKYLALGDITVFLLMGPGLVVMGTWAMASIVSIVPALLSLPVAFMVTAILHANNLRNIDTDRDAGIRTLAIAIGERASRVLMAALVVATWVSIAVVALTRVAPILSLATLLTAPLGLAMITRVRRAATPSDLMTLPIDAARMHLLSGGAYVILVAIGTIW